VRANLGLVAGVDFFDQNVRILIDKKFTMLEN
jgi:hypothetical protein